MLQDAATPTISITSQPFDLFSPTYHKHQAQKVVVVVVVVVVVHLLRLLTRFMDAAAGQPFGGRAPDHTQSTKRYASSLI